MFINKTNKFFIITCTMFSLLQANELHKIFLNGIDNNHIENVKHQKNSTIDINPKIKLKVYSNVNYSKFYQRYSLYKRTKKNAKNLLKKIGVNNSVYIKNYFNKIGSKKSIVMNAIIYDFVYKRPDLAENFYRLINKKFPLYDRMLKADFLLVTGRLSKSPELFSSKSCIIATRLMHDCFYYYGIRKFIKTGNNRQKTLYMSDKKKGKEIFFNGDISYK